MKNERKVQGFKDGSSPTEMIWVTISRSFWRTPELLTSAQVVDSTSVFEKWIFSEVTKSVTFSLEGDSDASAVRRGPDITGSRNEQEKWASH